MNIAGKLVRESRRVQEQIVEKSYTSKYLVVRNLLRSSTLDDEYYRKNRAILCVVTGIEHSGTTLLSQLLNGHPRIASGSELGILLSDIYNFSSQHPFFEWLVDDERRMGWGINRKDRDRLLTTHSFDEFYWLLNKLKGTSLSNPVVQNKFRVSDFLYDKTPRYVFSLSKVVRKIDVPFVVTLKTPYEQFASVKKRAEIFNRKLDIDAFSQSYLKAMREIESAETYCGDRLLIVPYKILTGDVVAAMERIKKLIGLDDDYELNLERYNEEYGKHVKPGRFFVKDKIFYNDPMEKLTDSEIKRLTEVERQMPRLRNCL